MVGNFNLGLIDWEHDPRILKHSTLVYKIEDSQHDTGVNELDVLLGPKWDMVDMSVTMDSFRIGKLFIRYLIKGANRSKCIY